MSTTKQKQNECCICNELIPLVGTQESIDNGTAWAGGNNAEPVVDRGSCCNKCNEEVVMPARLGYDEEYTKWYVKNVLPTTGIASEILTEAHKSGDIAAYLDREEVQTQIREAGLTRGSHKELFIDVGEEEHDNES